jgi:hypothetical protein
MDVVASIAFFKYNSYVLLFGQKTKRIHAAESSCQEIETIAIT